MYGNFYDLINQCRPANTLTSKIAVTQNDLGTERGGTKKVYEENRVKISFHKFPDDEGGSDNGLLQLLVFSVTPSKIDQNKNQNHSTDKVQNLGNQRM